MENHYILTEKNVVFIPQEADDELFTQFLRGYTCETGDFLCKRNNNSCEITSGKFSKAEPGESEYVINITKDGLYIRGKDYSTTIRGFMSFLEKTEFKEGHFVVKCGLYKEKPKIPFRSVHLCIFTETTLEFLRKCIRTCAVARYSHIVLEFWGTLKYDFMEELSWKDAYTKEQIRPIIAEANTLGIEIIPMFNHLGHASGSRSRFGKHVVLDQNPKLHYLFSPDGWVWNVGNEEVYEILRNIRKELIELCGEGKYFHIGCDEAYLRDEDGRAFYRMCEYLNHINADLKEYGRQTIIWGDMMLYAPGEDACFAVSEESARIIKENIDKDILVTDWHYEVTEPNWRTSVEIAEAGFEVLCAPWDNMDNAKSAITTINEQKLRGLMHTTWNTINGVGFATMVYMGFKSWGDESKISGSLDELCSYAATIVRKTSPSGSDYERAGWNQVQIGPGL